MRIFFATSVLMAIAPVAVALAKDCVNATSQTTMNVCADQAYRKPTRLIERPTPN
jgi:uncharacterized protein YecT (DUF1311 family)